MNVPQNVAPRLDERQQLGVWLGSLLVLAMVFGAWALRRALGL